MVLRETRLKEKYWRTGVLAASKLASGALRPPRLRLGLRPRQRLCLRVLRLEGRPITRREDWCSRERIAA